MRLSHPAMVIALAFVSSLMLEARPQQAPMTRQQVINLVKNQFGDKAGARSIEQRGIDFEPTPEFLDALKDAGADDDFIAAVSSARRVAPASSAKKPLSQVQVLALLGGQVPNHRMVMLVEQRGLDADPTDQFLGEVRRAGGDEELDHELRRATVIKPKNIDPAAAATEAAVRQLIARSGELNQKRQYAEAEQDIRAAMKLSPNNSTLLIDLSANLQYQNRWDESIPIAREAVRLDPSSAATHTCLGAALGSNEDFDGAAAEFREALRLDPSDDNAHYNLGVAYAMKADADGAISEYREALRLNPKNDMAHFGLGNRFEEDKHDPRAALEEFRTAYNLVPTNEKYKSSFERLQRELK